LLLYGAVAFLLGAGFATAGALIIERKRLRGGREGAVGGSRLPQEPDEQLRDEQAAPIRKACMESLRKEVREEVARTEGERIREQVRAEYTLEVRSRIVDEEGAKMEEQARRATREEIAKRIRGQEQEAESIRGRLRERLVEEEDERIRHEERGSIVADLTRRIRNEEIGAIREQVRYEIREQELERLHAEVREEIFRETVDGIRADFERDYAERVCKEANKKVKCLRREIGGDIAAKLRVHYDKVRDAMETVARGMVDKSALDSLAKTVQLLRGEKERFKYFNLNTVQTENMIDYLARLDGHLYSHFEKVDKRIKELVPMLNSTEGVLGQARDEHEKSAGSEES
jgi:hypothetical protein